MAITKNQSGTYAAVDIHYNRPACAPHQNVINYLDHLHIMVIHKSLTAYLEMCIRDSLYMVMHIHNFNIIKETYITLTKKQE